MSNVGFDFLGIKSPRWDMASMFSAVRTLPHPVPLGWFDDDTFGTKNNNVVDCLQSGCFNIARPHLAWTNHKDISIQKLIPRAQRIDAYAAAYPNISFYCSVNCEHPWTSSQSAAVHNALRPYLPHIKGFVDSGTRGFDPLAIRETHGNNANSAAMSFDGNGSSDGDIEGKRSKASLYLLLWDVWDNGKFSDEDESVPLQRKYFPTYDQFLLKVRSSYPMPIWPPGVPHIQAPEIWKPFAEGYPVNRMTGRHDPREYKPVAILNKNHGRRINILAMNGLPIGWMSYGGGFTANGFPQHRYYLGNGSGQTAFQLGQQAEIAAASEFAFLDAPGYRMVVNCYRRGGKIHT